MRFSNLGTGLGALADKEWVRKGCCFGVSAVVLGCGLGAWADKEWCRKGCCFGFSAVVLGGGLGAWADKGCGQKGLRFGVSVVVLGGGLGALADKGWGQKIYGVTRRSGAFGVHLQNWTRFRSKRCPRGFSGGRERGRGDRHHRGE